MAPTGIPTGDGGVINPSDGGDGDSDGGGGGIDAGGFGEELGGDPAGDADRDTGQDDPSDIDTGGFGEELGGDPAGDADRDTDGNDDGQEDPADTGTSGFGEELGGDPAGDADRDTEQDDPADLGAGGFGQELGGDPAGDVDRGDPGEIEAGGFGEELGGDPAGAAGVAEATEEAERRAVREAAEERFPEADRIVIEEGDSIGEYRVDPWGIGPDQEVVYRFDRAETLSAVQEQMSRTVTVDLQSLGGDPAGRPDPGRERADVSTPAGGFTTIRGGTPGGESGAPGLFAGVGVEQDTGPAVETETIGAAGPLGVTVPRDREPGITFAEFLDAVTTDPGAPGAGVPSGQGQDVPRGLPAEIFAAVTAQPAGPPGVGVLTSPPGQRPFFDIAEPTGQGDGTVDVPTGAPGVGVPSGQGQNPADDYRRIRAQIAASLAFTEVEETTPEDTGRVVGAAGPLGVTAPEDPWTVRDVREGGETAADAIDAFLGGLDEPIEGTEGPRELPAGAPGVGVPSGQGQDPAGDYAAAVEAASTNVEVPTSLADFEAGEPPDRLASQRDLYTTGRVTQTGPTLTELVTADLEETIVTVEEAERLPERREDFGDYDPVVGGIAVEPTLRRASAGFRDVTGAAAERSTDAIGLEEGSFADVAAETFVTTFPEIFNVPGLAADTLEIIELGGYVAGDVEERGPEAVEEGGRQIRAGAEYLAENPAVAVGGGAAILAQLPTSLATLRGLRAIDPRLARAQDIAWNTPERVARRSLGLTDEGVDPFFEVRSFGRELGVRADVLPGVSTRRVAFGGGEGPGSLLEIRAGGRTLATVERESAAGGLSPELQEALRAAERAERIRRAEAQAEERTQERQEELRQEGPDEPYLPEPADYDTLSPQEDVFAASAGPDYARSGPSAIQEEAFRSSLPGATESDLELSPRERQLVAAMETPEADLRSPEALRALEAAQRAEVEAAESELPGLRETFLDLAIRAEAERLDQAELPFYLQDGRAGQGIDTDIATAIDTGLALDTDTVVTPEMALDIEQEFGIEPEQEFDQETEPEFEFEPEPEQEPEQEPEPEFEFEAEPEQEPEPEFEFEPEPELEPEPEFFPDAIDDDAPVYGPAYAGSRRSIITDFVDPLTGEIIETDPTAGLGFEPDPGIVGSENAGGPVF